MAIEHETNGLRWFRTESGATILGATSKETIASEYHVPSLLDGEQVVKIDEAAFKGCYLLRRAFIPEGVREIENYAFADCSHLESVELPESLTAIGARAFGGCRALRDVVLPGTGVAIGAWAFEPETSLRFAAYTASRAGAETAADGHVEPTSAAAPTVMTPSVPVDVTAPREPETSLSFTAYAASRAGAETVADRHVDSTSLVASNGRHAFVPPGVIVPREQDTSRAPAVSPKATPGVSSKPASVNVNLPRQTDAPATPVAAPNTSHDEGSASRCRVKPPHVAGTRRTMKLDGVEYGFCYCPAGTFMMGSPASEKEHRKNERQHEVTLTRGFWMLETPCTQRLWTAVMGNNPSYFKGDDLPVEQVSYDDCQSFLSKLTKRLAPSGYEFRLPTEAEWEYACRAGTTTPFSWGQTLNGDKANCNGKYPYGTKKKKKKGRYLEHTSRVKSYEANPWGLYDMHGNVWEWCSDGLGAYPSGSVTDPTGPKRGKVRVGRGGGWYSNAELCRSAYRGQGAPTTRFSGLGFRFLLGPTR